VRILDGEIFEANADPRKRFSKSPPRSQGGGGQSPPEGGLN
jgi:hypothetical protein